MRFEDRFPNVSPGDMVRVYWYDAGLGESLSTTLSGAIDIPVHSFGVYLGTLGEKQEHIILAQNWFRLSRDLYDIDFTSIPIGMVVNVEVIRKGEASRDQAEVLIKNLTGHKRPRRGMLRQKRVTNHHKLAGKRDERPC